MFSVRAQAKARQVDIAPRAPERQVRVADAGIVTFGAEDLIIDPDPPEVGRAVCVQSGGRLAFRRVLGVDGTKLRLRADIAPFEDTWDGEIVGCVRPRLIDRMAAVDVEKWTIGNWYGAIARAHALAVKRRVTPRRHVDLSTQLLVDSDWPRVRQFWKEACGSELPVAAQPHQQVIGLFDGTMLVGANIHLSFGNVSYSAFTLVDRRYRGTGGGVKMIKAALAIAREKGVESIYVHINSRNFPSIRAYKRVGFVKKNWWSDASDPMASAERQWLVFEIDLTRERMS